ncbi:hypothetical protein L3X38_045608 [Prunus dulcis]|uniref:Uncharacterized protein n=2 Tax=Prunus dulcis TaxID=3755 RepID=A0AAD4US41_PRUDU|nr:hypothetical protein L3X38_045608 [Prunus dulcis]
MKDGSSSSSDDTSDEDVYSAGSDQARASKLLEKAKEKTLNLLDEDDEVPKSGVLSLPFMVRGLKKRNEAAAEEAKLALQEYESWSNQLEDSNGADNAKVAPPSGRMVFNASKKEAPESSNKTQSDDKIRSDNYYGNSDSEDDFEPKENVDIREDRSSDLQNNGGINPVLLHKESKNHKDSLFKNFDDVVQDPGPKTTHEVSIFASGTWKKMKGGNNADANANKPTRPLESVVLNQNFQEPVKDLDEYSDADSEGQMVDGILTSDPKVESSYELPSQAEIIRQAFAADDVEDDFEKEKQEVLNEENPEPEKPVLLPGWGQWTHAEKLYTKSLPYPFTSREVYEQSIRMPLGPEFNPATAVGALNRPEIMKKPGDIIKAIEFEEVNPYERIEEQTQSGKKQKKRNKRKKKKKNNVVISEAYPESEYNPTRDMLEGEGPVSIGDLLDPLHGVSGYSKLRKRIHHLEKKSVPTPAPRPKADQEKL